MKRILSTIIASVMVTTGLVATAGLTAAPASAANHAKCVTAKEHAAIKAGMSKKSAVKLLDGKGTKVSKKTRRYTRCNSKVKVYVTYDRAFTKKKAKVAAVRPASKPVVPVKPPTKPPVTPPVKPPTKPPVTPPVKPPTTPPVTPPATGVPSYPAIDAALSLETSIAIDWIAPKGANPPITAYRFGWWLSADNTWTSQDIPAAATPNPYVFTGLKPNTSYKLWIQAKNDVGWGEEQWATVKTLPATRPDTPPAPVTEKRTVVNEARCQVLQVVVQNQERTNTWQWNGAEWIDNWSGWTNVGTPTTRPARANDCVNVVDTLSSDVKLPDLRPKNLDACGREDLDMTNGSCFLIVPSAPAVHDFPQLTGKKLLKFPVLTMNAGAGAAEVIADRSSSDVNDWKAYQTFYRPNGERESQETPEVEFYFAGDGHNHWHFKDFDTYWIESLTGTNLRSAEKHGYCLEDNTKLYPLPAGAPLSPVYANATTCGNGLPQALTIIEGMSSGWGDTYPLKLPDQAIDITGLADGRYRVGVTVDDIGAVRESNNSNNTATMEITISGNTVTTHPETATGGLN